MRHCGFLLLGVVVLLMACSNQPGRKATSPPATAIGKQVHNRQPGGIARLSLDGGIQTLLGTMQTSYATGSWNIIRDQFVDGGASGDLVNRMQHWKSEHVDHFRVSLVYRRLISPSRAVITVEFAADGRTVPAYTFFVVQALARPVRIIGTASGLHAGSGQGSGWHTARSAHFVVYHSPYQFMGTDRRYLARLERQRATFASRFSVKLPPVVNYYLFPDTHSMNLITHGGCGSRSGETGCTRPFSDPPTIQAVLRATFHEPIHVYELALQPKPQVINHETLTYTAPLFIAEGTAVALEDEQVDPGLSDYCSDLRYAPLDECARIAFSHVQPLSVLADDGFKGVDPGFAYSLGGSFVKYLILHYGYRSFGRFYYVLAAQPKDRLRDYDVATRRVYRRSIKLLLDSWRTELCSAGC